MSLGLFGNFINDVSAHFFLGPGLKIVQNLDYHCYVFETNLGLSAIVERVFEVYQSPLVNVRNIFEVLVAVRPNRQLSLHSRADCNGSAGAS